ncbi:MAG: CoA transferase [Desulfarculus sp.]|nr:MAG: CoA transferase [Desulfarculus sp.]
MGGALSGLKVLDLTMNLPGPYMTWLLAGLGAEVVKVENPAGGDYARALRGVGGRSPYFEAVNRNKKSLALDLKRPRGREVLLALLQHYDVLVEGFRPGVMQRLGLDYATLSALQPRLILVSISGYGQEGPYRLRAGHDINYLAQAGVLAMTGARDGQLALPGVQIADLAGGSLLALVGLLAAVVQRQATGRGQFVDASMFDGSISLATMVFAGLEAGMEDPRPAGMALNGAFPCYNLYKTADGLYMSLGALEPKFWVNFCQALGRQDLLGHQFGGPDKVAEVAGIFAGRTRDEWAGFWAGHDACCEPVLNLQEAAASRLTAARGMIRRDQEGRRQLASPLKLAASPPAPDQPAPALGQHSDEVLGAAGLSPKDIRELRDQGLLAG